MNMKRNNSLKLVSFTALTLALIMACALLTGAATAENTATGVPGDTNPAISVYQKTQSGVVGVQTSVKGWDPSTRETSEKAVSQGSGVVIEQGGQNYILTNYHVVEDGTDYKVLLPSGEWAEATLVGQDDATDLAILKAQDETGLTPVTLGSSGQLLVGSTVIAIGNPGGSVLANTVTSGIVSALERDVQASNTTRKISYIQHDAAINSGNSGGGLFNVNGELIGINTLKYYGNMYASTSAYEGLGFAIPIDLVSDLVPDLIQYGEVRRPQMGVMVKDIDGPDEPMNSYPPKSVCVYTVNGGSPAEQAGMKQYDFITAIDGVKVTTLRELTTEMDKHKDGDTVEVTVVRYENPAAFGLGTGNSQSSSSSDGSGSYYDSPFSYFFGNNPYGNYYSGRGDSGNSWNNNPGSYQTVKLMITLKIPE